MATSGTFKTSVYDGACLQFDWSLKSQSTVNNQSVISWTLKGAGIKSGYWYMAGPFKCTVNGTVVYQSNTRIKLYTGTVVASGELAIGHDTNGAKSFSAYAECAIYVTNVNCKGSGSWSLPDIGRASQPSLNTWPNNSPDFNIGDTIVVHMNRKSTVFTHTVVLKLGSYSYTIGTGVTDNITLDTDRIASSLYAQMPNSNAMTGEIAVTTYSGSTVIGTSSCTIIAHVVNCNPTFDVSYEDSNSETVAITGNSQYIIRNNSTLQISVSNARALNSATLKTLTAVVNGNAYTGTLNGSTGTINVGVVNVSYDTEVTVKIVDSRGNVGQKKITVLVYDWSLPSAIIKLNRKSNYYSESVLNVNANYASIGGKNTVTIRYRTKKVSDSSYGSYATIQNSTDTNFTADNEYEWNVQVEVSDLIGKTTYNLILSKGIPITYTDIKKYSFGVNCFPKHDNSLEVNGVCISGQVLYNSASGTAGTVTLSDSAENYTYLEIFYRSSGDNACGSVKVFSPNGKLVHLGTIHYIADYDYAKFALVNVSGSMITFSQNYQIILKNNGSEYSAENAIYITRVVGY
uniref:Uncharacterized protein n=1 Tax=Siphoviridae sp. ctfW121 TaxID=2826413 RepID=A0A8S5N8S0_9CAUD|nr:MAG TPA: protein of unknown function DUF859 [Siphoviridae sp. ctfW121]